METTAVQEVSAEDHDDTTKTLPFITLGAGIIALAGVLAVIFFKKKRK